MQEFREQYLAGRERMHPELERLVKDNQTTISKNNAFPQIDAQGNRINFEELSSYKRFIDIVAKVKHYTGVQDLSNPSALMQLQGMLMRTFQEIMPVQMQYKSQLERLSIELVVREEEIPNGAFQFDSKLVGMGEISKEKFQQDSKEPSQDEIEEQFGGDNFEGEEFETPNDSFDKEKQKRRFTNALIQGSAKKGHYMFELVSNELNQMHPNLSNMYGIVMSINDLMYWMMPDEQMKRMAGNSVNGEEEIDTETEPPTIKAKGILFPILVHELIKGVYDVFGTHGFPDDPKSQQMIMDSTDTLTNEMWDLRLGGFFWERLNNMFPISIFEEGNKHIKHYLFARLVALETNEFNKVFQHIMMNNSDGKKFVEDMIYDIKKDMNERALKESLSQFDFESNDDEEEGYGLFKKGGQTKNKKGDIGKSGTQYGYTLKEWEKMAEKEGLLVSPTQWWKSQEGKKYKDFIGRNKTIGQHSGDKEQQMNKYGYIIANGMDLGSDIIPASAKKYVQKNHFTKYRVGGSIKNKKDMRIAGGMTNEDIIFEYPKDSNGRILRWINIGKGNMDVSSKTKTTGRLNEGHNLIVLKSETPNKVDYHILVDYLPKENKIYNVKGKFNTKPSPKYESYINDLFRILDVSKNKEMNEYSKGGSVKAIKKKAENLLGESISYRWVNTDMGSGWSFELESPLDRSVFNILEHHTYLDEFSPDDMGIEDYDDLSKEEQDYYYEDWKEELFQSTFEAFKEKCKKHLDDFIEYIQQAKEYQDEMNEYADGGGVGYGDKTLEEVWNNWSVEQRKHFLKDHRVLSNDAQDHRASLYRFDELPIDLVNTIKYKLKEHISDVRYAGGGETFMAGGMTNKDILRSFLTSERETQTNNLATFYSTLGGVMLLRNYGTLIAKRNGRRVEITNVKHSKTTSAITNRLKALAEEMGYNVSYVSEFEEGGEVKLRVKNVDSFDKHYDEVGFTKKELSLPKQDSNKNWFTTTNDKSIAQQLISDGFVEKYAEGGEAGKTYIWTDDSYVNIFLSRGFTEKRSAYGLRFFEHKPTGIFITYDPRGIQTPVIISKNKSGEESMYEGNTMREVKQALDNAGVLIIKEGIDPTYAEGGEAGEKYILRRGNPITKYVRAYYNETISNDDNGYQVNLMFYNNQDDNDYFDEEFITTSSPEEAEELADKINEVGHEGFLPKPFIIRRVNEYAEGGEAGKTIRDNYDTLVGRIGDEFYFLDSIFIHNDGFKGATGTNVMPVSKSYYEYATSEDGILERYMDAMGEDEWISTLGLNREDFEDEDDLIKEIEDGIYQLYSVGQLNPFEEVGSDMEEQMRALPQFSSSEEYPVFEIIGGGRIFGKETKFDEIYNQELFDKIKEIEEFAKGGQAGKKPLKSKIKNKDPKIVRQYFEDRPYSYAKGGFVSKAELVWKKLSSAEKMNFLIENFTPQITPRSQEILVGKAYNFLPKEVKITLASKYADVEQFVDGGEADALFEIVVVAKGLEKDGGQIIKDRFSINSISVNEAKNIAEKMWEKEMANSDFHIIEILTDTEYRNKYLSKKYDNGGGVGWNENALEELQEFEGDDEIEITTDSGDSFYASNDNAEYIVFKNYDDAYDYAYQMVNQDLVDNPEYFNQNWLSNFVDIDGAKSYLSEVYDEWNYSYANDIKMESDSKYSNRLISEMVDAGLMDDEDAESEDAESTAISLMDDFVEYMTNSQIDEGRGGLDYYEANFGEEQTMQMIIENNLIDIDEATEGAISEDGVAHFISSYDGNEIELPSGYYAYRTN